MTSPEPQSSQQPKFKMKISLNALNHLGINLYSNIPAVLSETVANAWDADATKVWVTTDLQNDRIIIEDNGFGMSVDDINNKFLFVGYQKREDGCTETPNGRKVMGRKGIGKLSLFSIAKNVEIHTSKEGVSSALLMSVDKIKEKIVNNDEYHPEEIPFSELNQDSSSGTKIILSGVKKAFHQADKFLKRRLSDRFSVIGDDFDFHIFINDEEITEVDRGAFNKVEQLFYYNDTSISKFENSTAEIIVRRPNEIGAESNQIKGWIGLVKEAGSLKESDSRENLNKISLIVRGKLAQEDILDYFPEGGLYTKYLIGRIEANFLDLDEEQDIATSSRQGFLETDPRFKNLMTFIQEELKFIQNARADFKGKQALDSALTLPSIKKWYDGLSNGSEKKAAKKLFGKINQLPLDENNKKMHYRYSALAFERMRYSDALELIEKADESNIGLLVESFSNFDSIEAALYYEITNGRLNIIKALKEKVNENALESVLQKYIYEHLWLLDPSWDRATEHPHMEEQIKTAFDTVSAKLSQEEKDSRFDIRYKKASGTHIIIELKRDNVKTTSGKLSDQVKKYRRALKKQLEDNEEPSSPIECICIVGKPLVGWEDLDEKKSDIDSLERENIRVLTYKTLINEAYKQYSEYLLKSKDKLGGLKDILDEVQGNQ